MAFRIHDSVVRGEIDNRVKGMVRGKIWVEGRGAVQSGTALVSNTEIVSSKLIASTIGS